MFASLTSFVNSFLAGDMDVINMDIMTIQRRSTYHCLQSRIRDKHVKGDNKFLWLIRINKKKKAMHRFVVVRSARLSTEEICLFALQVWRARILCEKVRWGECLNGHPCPLRKTLIYATIPGILVLKIGLERPRPILTINLCISCQWMKQDTSIDHFKLFGTLVNVSRYFGPCQNVPIFHKVISKNW